MNIRFEYLYRDAGNFKRWGEVVFANPRRMTVEAVAGVVDTVLVDHCYFDASVAGVPDLHFPEHIDALDHGWHEVHEFVATSDAPNDAQSRTIEEFVTVLLERTTNRTSGQKSVL